MMGTTKNIVIIVCGSSAERKLTMKHRIFALFLVLVLLVGVLAGCGKKNKGRPVAGDIEICL